MPFQLKEGPWGARRSGVSCDSAGFGMLEFLIAMAVFTAGMLGLLSAQLSGQRAIQAALDRSQASALAADLLARLELNPGNIAAYAAKADTLAEHRPSTPPVDCYSTPCTPESLAIFDWWEWSGQLSSSGRPALPEASVCVTYESGRATLQISWRGSFDLTGAETPSCEDDSTVEGNRRRYVRLSTIGGTT